MGCALFLNQPEISLKHFKHMLSAVKTPISQAKAYYWCGRANEAMGEQESAHTWYYKAGQFPSTYYGQLAVAKVEPGRRFKLNKHLPILASEKHAFERDEFVRITRLFAASGHPQEALPFLYILGNRMPNRSQRYLALQLTRDVLPSFAVQAVKKAEKFGLIMVDWAYPLLPFKTNTDVEKALILAVVRQESDFNPSAISSALAKGLMQVMPNTAQKIAKDIGLPYKESMLLTDPIYNVQLGTHYLKKKLQEFEGSYILAIASYNAGAKPVREWIKRNGDPRQKGIDLINWIEMIPYNETRTYVQRVLANLYVYRQVLKKL